MLANAAVSERRLGRSSGDSNQAGGVVSPKRAVHQVLTRYYRLIVHGFRQHRPGRELAADDPPHHSARRTPAVDSPCGGVQATLKALPGMSLGSALT